MPTADGGKCKNWSLHLALFLFITHVGLFAVAGVVYGVLDYLGTFNIALLASILFVFYKAYISAYFFWGHWQIYKVFKAAPKGGARSRNTAEHIGRRLGLVSSVNLMSLLMALLFSLPSVSRYHHGWILMIWIETFTGLTLFLEVRAVPSNTSREESLGRAGKVTTPRSLSTNRTPSKFSSLFESFAAKLSGIQLKSIDESPTKDSKERVSANQQQ